MGTQVNQGTRWETRLLVMAKAVGRNGFRLPKTGVKHEPDLFVTGAHRRPAVAWERWDGKKSDGRRRATRMVTVTEEHFIELLALDEEARFGYYVQSKSTQAGSLSAWLNGLSQWVTERRHD